MRTSLFIFVISAFISVLVVLNLASALQGQGNFTRTACLSGLTKSLMLTDLAIWTESRYTRHPSQADQFSAFQDAPGALEHFPAGSLVGKDSAMMVFEKMDTPGTRP